MKITPPFAILLAAAILGWCPPGSAQQSKSKAAPNAAPTNSSNQADAPPPPGWVARCSSPSRSAPLECAVEETAVLTKTGQLIVLVNIRVPSDTRAPVALVQLPLGLSLPSGAKIQVDDGKVIDLQIQTCENKGCYASTPIVPDVLTAMRSGKQLKVAFQNLTKETITIPMPLGDFAAAYDKIK
jgi:invasion protein IalB